MAKKPRPYKFKQARRDAKNPAKRTFSGQSRAGLKDKDPRTKLNTIDSEALDEFKQSGKNRGMKTPSGEFVKMEGYQDMAEYKAKQRAENEAFRSKMRAEFGEYAGKKATKSDYDSNPKIKERAPKATPAKAAPKQTAAGKLRSAVTVNEQAPQSYKIDKAGNKIKEPKATKKAFKSNKTMGQVSKAVADKTKATGAFKTPEGKARYEKLIKEGTKPKSAFNKAVFYEAKLGKEVGNDLGYKTDAKGNATKPKVKKPPVTKTAVKSLGKGYSAGKTLNAEGKAIYDKLIKEGTNPKSAMNKAIFRQEKGAKVAAKASAPIAKAAKSAASAVKKQGPVTGKQMSKVAKVVSYDPKTKMGTSRPEGLTPEVRKEIQAKYDAAVRNESGMTARQEAKLQRRVGKEDRRMSKLRAADPKKFDAREKLARNTKITPAQYAKERAKIGDTVRPKPAVAPKPNKYLNMQQAKKAATKVAKPGIKAALGSAVVEAAKSTFDIVGPGKKFKVLKKVAGLAGGMKAVKIAKASAAAKPGTKVLAANAARKAANITKAEKAAKAGKMGKVKKVGLAAAGFYALDKIPLGGGSKKPASTIGPSTKRPEGMYPKGGGKGLKFGPNVSINAGGSTTSYTVKKGDNLSKIAKEQGTTLAEIRKLNPIFTDKKNKYKGGNLIFSGTKVKLPTKK